MKLSLKRLIVACAAVMLSFSAFAQITTSSLGGSVLDKDGVPVIGAAVVATHVPSGTVYGVATNINGRYTINGMRPGGPYTVEISCLGYQTVTVTDVTLSLGDPYAIDQVLNDDKEMLQSAIVISEAASKFAGEKTGASTKISNSDITSLPTISRSITDVTKLSPYGGNGMSFAGSDGRTANFTVDGANFNNNFGLSSSLPGGGSPISIDAIEEMQVVISDFDVRQSNFIGGGVNAITKSGTNIFKASADAYHRNENMRGDAICGEQIQGARDKDRTSTFGATLGGPIVKNKLFFFANFEYTNKPTIVNRWKASSDGIGDPDNYISRTTLADMKKVQEFMKTQYGYDTGSYTDFPANESNMKILARIDWNITRDHHLAVRYNYTINKGWNSTNGSSADVGQRAVYNRFSQYSMAFANSLYSMDNKVHTWSLDLNSRFGDNISNQFLATFSMLDDIRGSNSAKFPFVDILDGTGTYTPYMSLGYELFTWNNGVHNRVVTVKDDITYFAGTHKITGGLSYEYQMADNAYMRNGTGYYRYNSLDDFLNMAMPESIAITYGYDGELNPAARVRYHKLSLYAQDDWNISDRFKLTYGIRLESFIYSNKDLMTNKAIYDIDYNGYHIDTGKWPTTKVQVSPRVGFTWDVLGDKSLKVRGGTGLFTGRLPLVFFTNMPTNSGMVQFALKGMSIDPKNPGNLDILKEFAGPMITDVDEMVKKLNSIDPKRFPTSISPKDGVAPSSIAAVDPKFKMPQVWKSSIAVDYAFPTPFPMSITGEFIFNKTVNGVNIKDLNIKSTEGFPRLNGADNRHIYPTDYKYTSTSAYLLTNNNLGYGYTASVDFNMQPVKNLSIKASYTYTAQKELTGMPGSDASSAFTYIPTYEGPNNPVLHNSSYVVPDRIYAKISYRDPGNNTYTLDYEAFRGTSSYTYMYADDLNGDSYNYDVMYIPKDDSEIRFATEDDRARYWAFADKDPYLKANKGNYAEAYSVYNPWSHRFNFQFAHDFVIKIGNTRNVLQLNCNINNLMNLFNSSWGVAKYMNTALNSGRILGVQKIDSDGTPVFTTAKGVNGNVETWVPSHTIGQCWYAQIGIRYIFN